MIRDKNLNFTLKQTGIIVPVYNNLQYTKKFYESFIKTISEPHKLIVIDNNSTDGTEEYFKSIQNDNLVYIKNEKNVGVAPAWNQGIIKVQELLPEDSYICILNNDIEFMSSNWVTELQKTLQSNPNVFYTSPRTCYDKNSPMSYKKVTYEQLLYSKIANDQYVVGCCIMLSPECIKTIGLFDEMFEMKYYEDLDYINRILQSGNRVSMTGSVIVYHVRGATSRITPGGENNKNLYEQKWKNSGFDILEFQPKAEFGIKHFDFVKGGEV